jgi:hypothetical protein
LDETRPVEAAAPAEAAACTGVGAADCTPFYLLVLNKKIILLLFLFIFLTFKIRNNILLIR